MPPRKKARLSSRAVSTLSGNAAELGEEPPTSPSKKELLSDVWTDEQEALLLKSDAISNLLDQVRWHIIVMLATADLTLDPHKSLSNRNEEF